MKENGQQIIFQKMQKIQDLFRQAQDRAAQISDIDALISILQQTEKEFLPVTYEGAAMTIALKDIESDNGLKSWKQFLDSSKKYACQIYIGLGWAMAQKKLNTLPFAELNKNMQFRIWDGCGYYDGILRQRQSLKLKNRLEYIQEKDHQAYDEGLGRSIWYVAKGDVSKAAELVKQFAPERQADLWRGVGIAFCFVGGFYEGTMSELQELAEEHSVQLGIAAAMVAKSRIESGCMTVEVDWANKIFNGMSADEAMKITVKNKSVQNFSFSTFISHMENDLAKN